MKTFSLIAASTVLALSARVAVAAPLTDTGGTPLYVATAASTAPVTRAFVKQETRAAEMQLAIPRGQAEWASISVPSTLSRAEVKESARVAEASHLIARGQQNFAAVVPADAAIPTRVEIKAQARTAEATRAIPRGEANVQY